MDIPRGDGVGQHRMQQAEHYRLPFRTASHHAGAVKDAKDSADASYASSDAANLATTNGHASAPEALRLAGSGSSKRRFPEHLHFPQSAIRRLRSPTGSSMSTLSSVSSAQPPDSATTTTCSLSSTLASPISTSYASEVIEQFAAHTIDCGGLGGRVGNGIGGRRIVHRQRGSSTTCSTFVDLEEEAIFMLRKKELDVDFLEDEEYRVAARGLEAAASPISSEATVEERVVAGGGVAVPDSPRSDAGSWDTSSTTSEDHTHEDATAVLDYTLQLLYGVDAVESSVPLSRLEKLTHEFLSNVGQVMREEAVDGEDQTQRTTGSLSSSPAQDGGVDDARKGEKRKVPGRNGGGHDGLSDDEGTNPLRMKRLKPSPRDEENLRLSCPFRKRNPNRFNVRDHHSCAMTYFPKFAELRQHIVKQHKRDDPTAFVCDRCNTDFPSRKGLRDHQRLPREEMCEISEHNPESGIDGPTSNKLLSRKRASGASAHVQWREIWNILFPDDDDNAIRPYDFTPVIEHFEISDHFEKSFKFLQGSLRDMMENPATLETLAAKFHQCFIETVGQCILNAQSMPYTNRSNKRGADQSAARLSRVSAIVAAAGDSKRGISSSRPDSGVVMDDGSEESGSVLDSQVAALRHNSVRTVKGWGARDSVRVLEAVPREVVPSQRALGATQFDDSLLAHFGNGDAGLGNFEQQSSSTMDPLSVQSWNNAVMPPPSVGQSLEPSGLQGYIGGDMVDAGSQQGEMIWDDTFYQAFGPMPTQFPGFVGQRDETFEYGSR